jgi:glucokinase
VVTATLGIDLGGTMIKAVVCGPEGDVRDAVSELSRVGDGPQPTLRRLIKLAQRMRDAHPVESVGLGICGPVDHENGVVVDSPILPGWHDVAIAEPLAKSIGLPVRLENDAACAMLGEWWQGAGAREALVAGLTVGTGIGGGLVIEGEIYRGSSLWGAEFGHIAVADGPQCPCGGHGCVTQVASITATLDRYEHSGGGRIDTFAELLNRRESGERLAYEALDLSIDHIADAVRVLLNALNPSSVVLAGGMAQWGEPLAEEVTRRIKTSTFRGLDDTPVRAAELGLYSGAIGAARLAAM